MKKRRTSRILSIVLLVAMLLTLMPATAFAEDEATVSRWELIGGADAIGTAAEAGTVAITMTASDGTTYVLSNNKGTSAAPTGIIGVVADGELLIDESSSIVSWDITAEDDGYTIYSAANSNAWLYSTDANNGVRVGTNTAKKWVIDSNYLKHEGTGRFLGVYTTNPDWRAYTTINNNIKNETLQFWKLSEGETPDPTDPPEPTETPEVTISPISEALAASSGEFTVKGVVTLVDGKNIYVQDETGGICLFFGAAPNEIALGDTVIGTGTRSTYRGLPELTGASFEKSEGMTLEPKTTTLDAITAADVCTYVFIEKLTVTAINGNNTTVADDAGNTFLFYKAVADPALAVGDVFNFLGAVGIYDSTLQLRNTLAGELTPWEEPPAAPAAPTADPAEGTVVAGTVVTFSTETEGAVIFYSLDNGETWTEGNSITLAETGTVTIQVKAVKDELSSEIATFTYNVEPVSVPISDALAASEGEFTVKGVVTLVDGRNIYVQDETGGICLYFSAAPTDIALGDTVIGTGTRATYKGLPELSGASYVKSSGLTLEPKTTTLAELGDADICTYVTIEKLTVTAISSNNTTVADDAGNTILLFKAVADPALAVGDVINFTGAVGIYNSLQLRNTLASEITEWTAPVDPGLVILFTNDVHCGIEDGWGYAGLADLKKTLEAEGNTVLLVDAGDHVQGGPIGTLSEGAYIIDIMNFVGYDLAIPGNHEFDYTMTRFFENVESANFPYISANFMNYADGEPTTPVLDAYKIFEADGKKVAFVGLCTPETITKSTPTYFQDADGNYIYGFCQDATGAGVVAAAQAAVDAARAEGADYVILVGHLGIDEQSSPWTAPEIVAQLSGVDAIIDGHSHSTIDAKLTDKDGNPVLHGQTGTKLANIGMLRFLEDGSVKIDLLPASEKVQDDPETAEYIAGIKAQYSELLQEVVAYTPYNLTTKDPDTGARAVRSNETNLGDLCADAYLNVMGADIAFVNGGGIRADIPAGDITFEQILNVHPFGNAACLVEVSGQQILDALEHGSRMVPGENGGFLQVAGLTYEIHTELEPNVVLNDSGMWTGTAGKPYRVQNVQVLNKDTGEYEPLDLTKTYKLASHNYMLKNQGDGYGMFGTRNVTILQDEVLLDNKVLINYIQSLPGDDDHEHAVTADYSNPRGQGRITIVTYEMPENSVVVLFTNDVHCGIEDGWGYAGLADLKKTLEARGNTVLLVDAGDHVQGGPIGTLSEGAYIIDIMNFVGYDLAIPGNHEFDYTMAKFFENVESANFPYISANFMNYADGEPTTPVLDAYKIFEVNGKKVAFVGLCTPETITKSTPTYFQDADGNYIYGFCQDATGAGVVTAAQAAVDAARAEGADYVIVVGHLGIDEQSSPWTAPEIVAQLSGVDAILDGHSHSTIDTVLTDKDGNPVLHGQTGTKLANIGMLVIGEESLEITLVPASDKEKDDEETAAYIAGIKSQYAELLQEVVAYTPYVLTTKDPDTGARAVRSSETNLGDLCADAYLNMLGADIAFVNGGGVRADIPAGDITFEQILNVHPFGNAACLVEVSGQQILDALEHGSRNCPGENGGFLQVAGLTYEIHTYLEPNVVLDDSSMWTGTAGKPYRVQNVQVLNKDTGEYEPLDLTKTYKLASHNYMLKNQGDGYGMFGTRNVTILQDEVMLDNKVLINYIQSLPGDGEHEHAVTADYADPRGQGRITIVTEGPEVTTLFKFTSAPENGDKIVIFYPAGNLVMTNTVSGRKLAGTAATPENDTLVLTEEMSFLTVSVADGVYTFTNQEGKYLTSGATGNSLSFADEESDYSKWTMEQQSDGTWIVTNLNAEYIKNDVAYKQSLEYYSGFTTYNANTTAAYKFDFYGVIDTTNLPKLSSAPVDGAQIVIFYPAGNLVMTNTVSGKKLAGEAATPENDILVRTDTMSFLTVSVADGVYTFTNQEGKYLTSGATGNSLSFADEESDYSKWTMEQQSDGTWIVTNLNAEYIKNDVAYKQSLEYYNGFTTYNANTTAAYKFDFYGISRGSSEEPPTPGDDTIKVGTLVTSLDQLTDGATVLIYSPTHKTAASSVPNGDWYIKAVGPVTDSFTAPLVWTVSLEDGAYKFSNGDSVLSAWLSGNYVELTVNPNYNAETVSTWNIAQCNAETSTWYVSSSSLTLNDNPCYVEAFTKNGSEVFSGYATNKPSEANYGLQFYLVNPDDASEETDDGTWDGVLNKGSSYVIYNASAEGVLGIPNEMGIALTNVPATIENNKAVVTNGALVFTVADNPGRYYVLEVGGKYLASNNAEELFFSDEITEFTKWYLTKNGTGYILYNKTANYNGNPVCIEFFSGTFSGWTYKSTDADIFRFNFYALADGTAVVNGVAQVPNVKFACEDSRYIEQDYEVKFTLDDLAPEISTIDISYTVGETTVAVSEYTVEGKTYSFTIPASELDGQGVVESFTLNVQVTNSYALSYQGVKTVAVLDEPFIGKLTPAANAQTLDDKRPVISAEIGNVGENAVFTMTVNDEPVDAVFEDGILSYQAEEDMVDGRYTVIVTVTRADGKEAQKMWSFYVGKAQFQLYFGQLHSHTTYSDGSGSLDSALEYISNIPESGNIQFVAFTDHSNYFDSTSAPNPEAALYDVSQMTAASTELWNSYRGTVAAFNASQSTLIAIAGFEMTWSGGPGHINTFNSPGIVSRNNSTLNNKTNDAGMKAYYATLDNEALANSLSQFNHPGKTFGNFSDFSYWDAVTDSRIFLVEVGNGEGQIGAGGYYPSYEQYIMALDKGWHVAPTNNQDNHKGKWGNANDARDVIYTDDFSEQGIYNAIRLLRVYATEDKNLEIQYTVNGEPLGTIFSEVPEELNFSVSLYDPDSTDLITKVELVVNSGAVAYTWSDPTEIATGLLEVTLAPDYSYYFVRVTQADGDLAVTAPVWVGESLKLGISAVECGTSTPVTGEEFTLTTTFFNSEASAAVIKSIVYTVNGSEVIGTDTAAGEIPASSTAAVEFKYTPTKAKIMTITVTAVVELDGKEYTFSKDIELEVKDAGSLVYIGIDASHYNEYVAGNYKDSMGNFGALAAGYGVRTVELKTSEELIAACSNEKFVAIIFTAPSRRLAAAQSDPKTYSDEELAAIAAFNANGGQVIVCGWGDNYENYSLPEGTKHMAATQNELLAALGSSIRLGDDEVMDDELNGGQSQRLYLSTYNFDSFLLNGVEFDPENPNDALYTERYSNYGGCSVFFTGEGVPATVTPIVYGHATTYIKDCDGDGRNELFYPYGDGSRVVVLASEQIEGQGLIIVSGAAFMSNFEVQATVEDNGSEKNYSNYKICENLVRDFNEVTITDIAEVQAQTEIGLVYTIEGVVTSNASGYDKDTAFFDCIYVQDETAGICCFPVSGNYKIGDVVRITGYTDFYQAEMELQVMSITKIGETDPVEPTVVTAAQINDLSVLGSLVTLKGTVESFEYENGLIQTIMVKDDEGNIARVFIDGYITTAEDVQNLTVGCRIEATGLSSYDDTWKDTEYFPRIRVRNRADIVCTAAVDENAAVIYGKSLSLKGKIALNFYLVLPESVTGDANAYVTIGETKLPVAKAKTSVQGGKTCHVFTVYVKFAQLTEERVVRVFTGDDTPVTLLDNKGTDWTETGFIYRAQDYIENVRANSADEKLLALVNALSDLGSLAQAQFGYNLEAREEVLGDLSAVTADTVSEYAPVVEAKEALGISYYGSSLLLTEQTQIRHYFTVKGSISQFTFKVDGKTVQPVKKGSYYYIEISNVVAKDLNRTYHVEVSNASSGVIISIDYSALSYVYKTLSKGGDDALTDLLKGLVLYSQAADEYFGA